MSVYWSSLADFMAMGGHAGFIWSSFGLAAAVLLALALHSHGQMKAAEREHAEARQEAGREGNSREGASREA